MKSVEIEDRSGLAVRSRRGEWLLSWMRRSSDSNDSVTAAMAIIEVGTIPECEV